MKNFSDEMSRKFQLGKTHASVAQSASAFGC